MKKTLLICSEFPPLRSGGAQYNYNLACAMAQIGHDVTIHVVCNKNNRYELNRKNIKIISTKLFKNIFLRKIVNCLHTLVVTRLTKWDYIFLCDWGAHSVVGPFFYLFPQYIIIFYGSEIKSYFQNHSFSKFKLVMSILMEMWVKRAIKIICISKYTKETIEQFQPSIANKTEVVLPGIVIPENKPDLTALIGVLPKKLIYRKKYSRPSLLLSVARLHQHKGVDSVIKAMSTNSFTDNSFIYIVAGDGPYKNELQKLVCEYHLENRVIFTGFVSEIALRALYTIADIFVLPTKGDGSERIEGFGLVFIESLLHGTPVIAGGVGGVFDAVRDNVEGIIVNPHDQNKIFLAIEYLLSNPLEAKRMGALGMKRIISEGNINMMAQKIIKFVESDNKSSGGLKSC